MKNQMTINNQLSKMIEKNTNFTHGVNNGESQGYSHNEIETSNPIYLDYNEDKTSVEVYLGADVMELFKAAAGLSGKEFFAFITANSKIYEATCTTPEEIIAALNEIEAIIK